MEDLSSFSETYSEARSKFLSAASSAGATLCGYQHPELAGPEGEPLFLDVARLGSPEAEHVFAIGCGTHGIEGYSGSAAQTNWLRLHQTNDLPPDVAILFFHAHNPWGFAHALRFTEENVDLNRNFIDFTKGAPANPEYSDVHDIIDQQEWDEGQVRSMFDRLSMLRDVLGEQRYSDAFNGGQYSHPNGIFYGGTCEQWSNRAFRQAVGDHMANCVSAAFLDLHTGIGPERGHVFLCFHPPGSMAYERARVWWGDRAVNREGVTHKAVANYQGLLVDAFVAMLPTKETTAIVVEFGTLPRPQMQRASMAARWLWATRHQATDIAQRGALMRDIREAFYPSAADWRVSVLRQSKQIIDQGILGIVNNRS